MSFTAGELASMRATANEALPDAATVLRRTVASDGGGGQTETWATAAATAPCRIAPLAGGEGATAGDRAVDETTHILTLPAGTDVRETDRAVVGSQTYEVTLVRQRAAWEITRRAEVRELA